MGTGLGRVGGGVGKEFLLTLDSSMLLWAACRAAWHSLVLKFSSGPCRFGGLNVRRREVGGGMGEQGLGEGGH